MTPEKLAKVKKNEKDKCRRRKPIKGRLYHMWWGCKCTRKFWKEIEKIITLDLKIKIEM